MERTWPSPGLVRTKKTPGAPSASSDSAAFLLMAPCDHGADPDFGSAAFGLDAGDCGGGGRSTFAPAVDGSCSGGGGSTEEKGRKKLQKKKNSRMILTVLSRGKMDVMDPDMKSKVASNCWNVLVLG